MGCPCARRTRTMKQCSSDAHTMGHPTHSPFEFTATGRGSERKCYRSSSHSSSTKAVAQRRSDYAPRASQPWPKQKTPAKGERVKKNGRAGGRAPRSVPPVKSRQTSRTN